MNLHRRMPKLILDGIFAMNLRQQHDYRKYKYYKQGLGSFVEKGSHERFM